VGATDAQVSQAASSVNIVYGLTSLANYAQAIYGKSPAAAAASGQWLGTTVVQYMAVNPTVAALAQPSGNNLYINPTWINGMSVGQQQGLLLHELLHQITGKGDDAIQDAFGLPHAASQNIGDKLQKDCF
jgi:hypothetical protein